jgi:hypothetical protein
VAQPARKSGRSYTMRLQLLGRGPLPHLAPSDPLKVTHELLEGGKNRVPGRVGEDIVGEEEPDAPGEVALVWLEG